MKITVFITKGTEGLDIPGARAWSIGTAGELNLHEHDGGRLKATFAPGQWTSVHATEEKESK